jgi:hypothetical protein
MPEGASLSAKALLHLGSRAAVDQALSRLARSGELLRAGRGVYVLPVKGKFGARAPEVAKVVQEWASQRGETVVGNGATAANALGLTTQVPVRQVFLTSGRSRKLKLGAQTVELKHAPPWQLLYPGQAAGEVIRSLAWAGPRAPRRHSVSSSKSCRRRNCRPSPTHARACPPGWPARSAAWWPVPEFFTLPREDQSEALLVAAERSGRPLHLLEKDVWVVWALQHLFTGPHAPHLVFKGGTSLSKAYGVIKRFSEDVDLTYDIRAIAPDLIEKADSRGPRRAARRRSGARPSGSALPNSSAGKLAPELAAALPSRSCRRRSVRKTSRSSSTTRPSARARAMSRPRSCWSSARDRRASPTNRDRSRATPRRTCRT